VRRETELWEFVQHRDAKTEKYAVQFQDTIANRRALRGVLIRDYIVPHIVPRSNRSSCPMAELMCPRVTDPKLGTDRVMAQADNGLLKGVGQWVGHSDLVHRGPWKRANSLPLPMPQSTTPESEEMEPSPGIGGDGDSSLDGEQLHHDEEEDGRWSPGVPVVDLPDVDPPASPASRASSTPSSSSASTITSFVDLGALSNSSESSTKDDMVDEVTSRVIDVVLRYCIQSRAVTGKGFDAFSETVASAAINFVSELFDSLGLLPQADVCSGDSGPTSTFTPGASDGGGGASSSERGGAEPGPSGSGGGDHAPNGGRGDANQGNGGRGDRGNNHPDLRDDPPSDKEPLISCPFRKHDPDTFRLGTKWRLCATNGFKSELEVRCVPRCPLDSRCLFTQRQQR